VNRKELVDGLDLDDEAVLNQEVDDIATTRMHAFVSKWQIHFASKQDTS
jgi:hypothetical protein